jgi:hypothetical protein
LYSISDLEEHRRTACKPVSICACRAYKEAITDTLENNGKTVKNKCHHTRL